MGDHLVQYIGKSVRVRQGLIHITYLNFFCSTSVDSCNSWLFLRSSSLSSSLSISLEIEIIVCIIIVVWTNKDKLQHPSGKRDSCLMKSSSKQSIHIYKTVRMSSDPRLPMRISQLLALKSGKTIWIPWEHQVCLGLSWPFWVHPRLRESTRVRRGQPGSIWVWQNHLEPGTTTTLWRKKVKKLASAIVGFEPRPFACENMSDALDLSAI